MSRLLIALLCAAPAMAAGDAAIKAQEGDIRHWIEHYQRERQARPEARTAGEQAPNAQTGRAAPAAQERETKR